MGAKRRVLIIGGAFSGSFAARDLKKHFHVTIVDAKEFFEYTPGILRCFVKPEHFDSLSFTLQPVFERSMGVKFIWGEVTTLDADKKCAIVKTMYSERDETIEFDYCMICSGCNFGPLHKWGESLWFPTVHARARPEGSWPHIDERFLEGRRRHILEEYTKIKGLNSSSATILVVGAGFIGVEWITELQYYFGNLKLTIIDMMPRSLGPLPDSAAKYCQNYLDKKGIKSFYSKKFAPDDAAFWKDIELPNKADCIYECLGVKASNYFMPKETLSAKGPGGGGWIYMNKYLQVCKEDPAGKDAKACVWGDGTIFAIGDCNYGCIGVPSNWELPPIPKISYPGEEQALHACKNIDILDRKKGIRCDLCCCLPNLCHSRGLMSTWWPWGAGMFATSLGPHDACFVIAANHNKHSGYMVNWSLPSALQKEIIETTKVNECKDGFIGKWIWHYVHHTPVHLFGKGVCKSGWCVGHSCC